MLTSFLFALVGIAFGNLPNIHNPTRFVQVESLTHINGIESQIFGLHHLKYNKEHDLIHDNVFVHDKEHNKFFNMSFRARHHKHKFIFKMEDQAITHLKCEPNALIFTFSSKSKLKTVVSALSSDKETIIAGSFLWRCVDAKTGNYLPILRRLTSKPRRVSENGLLEIRVETVQAKYTDVFEHLDVSVHTNVVRRQHFTPQNGKSEKENYRGTLRKFRGAESKDDPTRRRLSIKGTLSKYISNMLSSVTAWINEIKAIWAKFTNFLSNSVSMLFSSKTYSNTSPHTWSFNYNPSTKSAKAPFNLNPTVGPLTGTHNTIGVNCMNCYVVVDLTITWQMTISWGTIKHLKLVYDGKTTMETEFLLTEVFAYEWGIDTPKVPVPYLGFSIGLISFGLNVYGHFGIGIEIAFDFLYMKYKATGTMTRGIDYYHPSTYNYISSDSWSYTKSGPHLPDTTVSLSVYLRPSVFLELSHIGAVYAGVEPRVTFVLSLAKPNAPNGCYLNYAPTVMVSPFVGAYLDPFGHMLWQKEAQIHLLTTPLTQWNGCITRSTILAVQSQMSKLGLKFTAIKRRRLANGLLIVNSSVLVPGRQLVNVSKLELITNRPIPYTDRFWGLASTLWFGNISHASTGCVNGRPKSSLVLQRQPSNSTAFFVGLHQIEFPLNVTNMTTNVSCSNAYEFIPVANENFTYHYQQYDVKLLDQYCDVNASFLSKVPRTSYILPSQMHSIRSTLESNAGVMYDQKFCHVHYMTLHKPNNKPVEDNYWLKTDPLDTWVGRYDCNIDGHIQTRITFVSYNNNTGDWIGYLTFRNPFTGIQTRQSIELKGKINSLMDTIQFSLASGGRMKFPLNGQGINALNAGDLTNSNVATAISTSIVGGLHASSNGDVSFVGRFPYENCSAWVMQGYAEVVDSDGPVARATASCPVSPSSGTSTNEKKPFTSTPLFGALIGILVTVTVGAIVAAVVMCGMGYGCAKGTSLERKYYSMADPTL